MGFDKSKALNAAEKSLAQGKIAAAIQEYRKIVDHDAQDFSALNTIGDLYSRTGKPADAIECFVRVADHYREQGFALKAIAMYKKISRLDPGVNGVAHHLARLYEQQGLYVEARAQYHQIADAAARQGRMHESLEALRRIADLDHKNSDIRLRLAEGYAREGMEREAADAYVEAGALLLGRGKPDEALTAYRLAQKLVPAGHAALEGLVTASCRTGVAGDAAALLEQVLKGVPGDLELRAMLARTYIEAEDAGAAERATDALVQAEPSNYTLWFDVARLYLKRGEADAAVRVLGGACEPALTGKQEFALREALTDVLSCEPSHVEALKLMVRVHGWRRDDEQMRDALERLAAAAHDRGDAVEERRALEHLVRLVPFDQGYHERLHALGGAQDPPPAEAPPAPATASDRPDSPSLGAPSFDAPAPGGLEFGGSEFGTFSDGAAAPFEYGTFDAGAFDPTVIESPARAGDEFAPGVTEFEWNAASEPEPPRPERLDPSSSFADLSADFADGPAPRPARPAAFDLAFEPTALEAPGESEIADPFASAAPPQGSDGRADAMLRQELESVDFYLAQGYTDIAADTLDMLERQFGHSPEIDVRRGRLGAAPAPDATSAPAADFGAALVAEPQPFATEAPDPFAAPEAAAGWPVTPAVVEEFRVDESAFGEFANSPGPDAGAQSSVGEVRPTASQPAPPPRAAAAAPRAESRPDPQMADLFGEFLDSEQPAPDERDDDFETRFNLGLAYKEMYLWDEAVEQFQQAIEAAAPGDGTPRYLQCCNMLGHCLSEKGLPRAAAIWFKKALAIPALSDDESQALRYDLASAYEAMGDIDRAVDTLTEVYAVDVSYRGVADKLRELQSRRVGVGE